MIIKKNIFYLFLITQKSLSQNDQAYLYSYFVNNGEDGLHLAYSIDGLKWETLNNNKSFLTPTVGNDKLMRGKIELINCNKPNNLTMIPYYAWANGKLGEMAVWLNTN